MSNLYYDMKFVHNVLNLVLCNTMWKKMKKFKLNHASLEIHIKAPSFGLY
jgi:hypothetical protein